MDLRELYESMLASKHLRRTKRFKVDRKYYSITYEIHHKRLIIKKLNRIWYNKRGKRLIFKKSNTQSVLVLYRRKNFVVSQSSRCSSPFIQRKLIKTELPINLPQKRASKMCIANRETQTVDDDYASHDMLPFNGFSISCQTLHQERPLKVKRKSTQTPIKYLKSQQIATDNTITDCKAEQTFATTHATCCQTDQPKPKRTQAVGIDVRPTTQNSANQTHIYYYGKATQTTPHLHMVTAQTDLSLVHDDTVNCRETIIKLLNEIGDALLLQNTQFEQVQLAVLTLFDWTHCINTLLMLRRRKHKYKRKYVANKKATVKTGSCTGGPISTDSACLRQLMPFH